MKNKCIQLGFDEEAFLNWVGELTQQDKRVAGLKDFEWNMTVTTEQKHIERVRKLAKVED
jgi:colicin import membrane protein